MLEMYQFARSFAASVTPDPEYMRAVQQETLDQLRQRRKALVEEGVEPGLATLVAIEEFRTEAHLTHWYPSRDGLGVRLQAATDAVKDDPLGWTIRVLGVTCAVLAAVTVAILLAMGIAALVRLFLP